GRSRRRAGTEPSEIAPRFRVRRQADRAAPRAPPGGAIPATGPRLAEHRRESPRCDLGRSHAPLTGRTADGRHTLQPPRAIESTPPRTAELPPTGRRAFGSPARATPATPMSAER